MPALLLRVVGQGALGVAKGVRYEPQAGPTFDNPDRDVTDTPAPPVTVGGVGHLKVVDADGGPPRPEPGKPPYRIPTLAEIHAVPSNGLKVASTFAGGGGSCTGYRWAGYDVVWANEFVAESRATYQAAHPTVALDGRDIRDVQPHDLLELLGLAVGELDLLDGSPPCQSFSTAGKREKGWGRVTSHNDGSTQRSDDLFFEYARLLEGLQPRVFVAENVSGLVKGVAKGYFKEIHRRLAAAGYRVQARLLDAQWLGVPQQRVRTIFVGVREDLERDPVFPTPQRWRYTVRDALADITPGLEAQIVGNDAFKPVFGTPDRPHPTVMAGGARTSGEIMVTRPSSDPRRGGEDLTDRPMPTVGTSGLGAGRGVDVAEPEAWEWKGRAGAVVDQLRPDRKGLGGASYYGMRRLDPDRPAGTVQASEATTLSTNQVHPVERRRLYIAELKRICGFPDDYPLQGSYAEQWARLGNSVPPPMMRAIAAALAPLLLEER